MWMVYLYKLIARDSKDFFNSIWTKHGDISALFKCYFQEQQHMSEKVQ